MVTCLRRSVECGVTLCCILYSIIMILPTSEFSLRNCLIPDPFNYSGKLTVYCYKMGFQTVPSQLPDNVATLVISFNYISQIRVEDFCRLTSLTHLNASNNLISRIQEGAFKNSSDLEELNLSQNLLTNISGSWLQGLHKLSILRLDGNLIEHMEQNVFGSLLSLKILNLTNNKLQQMERIQPALESNTLQELYIGINNLSIFQSSDLTVTAISLKMLDLSQNPLTKFQMTENIFPALEYLDLSYCSCNGELDWIVPNATLLKTVTTLKLDGVRISEEKVAAIIGTFNTSLYRLRMNDVKPMKADRVFSYACSNILRVLHFGDNNITSLTEHTVKPCYLLEQLDLTNDSIHHISEQAFRNFTHLMSLHLQYNRLTKLNGAFRGLPMLKLLDLSANNIQQLNCSDFDNLVSLKKLYLYNNKITYINACLFKDLKNLQRLKLGTNKLLTVFKSFTEVLPKLKYLQLRYNKISSLNTGTFANLYSLETLDLVDNQISKIEKNAFAGLGNLTCLYLASNKITENTIKDMNVFSGLFKLNQLDLNSNYIAFQSEHIKSPPFFHLKRLRTLALNSQRHRGLHIMPSNLLKGLSSLNIFYAGNLNIMHLHPNTFNYTPHLWHLDLTRNKLSDNSAISPQVFHPIPKLARLILSRSELQSLDFLIEANLSQLSFLRATGNQIAMINQTLIQSIPSLKFLDLQNNTFPCDCNSAFFIDWSRRNNRTQVLYLNKYICNSPSAMRMKSIEDFHIESCIVDYNFICFLSSSLIVAFTLVVSFVYSFLRWHLVYTYYLILALLHARKRKQQQHGFQYDAFISYNITDEPWVMEELLPNLENDQGWRVCLHHRDFQPGRSITDNIIDAIYNSRKTICLISRNYLNSNWCSQEIQVARFRHFDEQKDVLILIFLEDIPTRHLSPYYKMKKLVQKQTYLSWPKAGHHTRVFWQKVKMAMET